jgi:hypothetical protein
MKPLILFLFFVTATSSSASSFVSREGQVQDDALTVLPSLQKRNGISSHQIGEFVIEINLEEVQITITKSSSLSKILYQTTSHLFLQIGEANVTQPPIVNGNYQVHEAILWRSVTQTIDEIQEKETGTGTETETELVITGTLSNEALSYSTNYFLSYYLSMESDNQLSFTIKTSETKTASPSPSTITQSGEPNRLFLSYVTSPEESFHGFGESFTSFDLKGKRVPILVSEQGVGRDLQPITNDLNNGTEGVGGHWYTTYAPKPLYLTNQNRSLLFDNSEVSRTSIPSSPYWTHALLRSCSLISLNRRLSRWKFGPWS